MGHHTRKKKPTYYNPSFGDCVILFCTSLLTDYSYISLAFHASDQQTVNQRRCWKVICNKLMYILTTIKVYNTADNFMLQKQGLRCFTCKFLFNITLILVTFRLTYPCASLSPLKTLLSWRSISNLFMSFQGNKSHFLLLLHIDIFSTKKIDPKDVEGQEWACTW